MTQDNKTQENKPKSFCSKIAEWFKNNLEKQAKSGCCCSSSPKDKNSSDKNSCCG